MSQHSKYAFGRLAWAGAAVFALAAASAARAEMPARAGSAVAVPAVVQPLAAPPLVRPALGGLAALPSVAAPVVHARCAVPPEYAHFNLPLTRTAMQLAGSAPLTIVAVGSSSTAGAGASSAAASYPSRLAVELRKLFPGRDITVINRGVNGEETRDMMARFATGVLAEHPQLVLWQLGTNSVLRDHPLKPHAVWLHEGIAKLRESRADVVLIDPQYAPRVLAKSETSGMLELIAAAAKQEHVDLFQRFAVMKTWYEAEQHSFAGFISPDGVHMNDWGYACWAKLLAAAIADAAGRPFESAAAHGAR